MSNALELFRAGFDYLQIASHLNTTEAEVERQIHQLRTDEWQAARAQRIRAARSAKHNKGPRPLKTAEELLQVRRDGVASNRANLRDIRRAHR